MVNPQHILVAERLETAAFEPRPDRALVEREGGGPLGPACLAAAAAAGIGFKIAHVYALPENPDWADILRDSLGSQAMIIHRSMN
jgi:hypothetical protein